MSDDKPGRGSFVDLGKSIQLDGEAYYLLVQPDGQNRCAGKDDGTSCGPGCVCRGGQCYYTFHKLQELGVKLPDK